MKVLRPQTWIVIICTQVIAIQKETIKGQRSHTLFIIKIILHNLFIGGVL